MATRCEYCGQLFEGLSCPHCGAPRSDDARTCDRHYSGNNVVINGNDNVVSITSDGERIIYADDIPYVSTDNVVVYPDGTKHRMSDGNIFYADNSMYWMSDGAEETDYAGTSERKRAKKIIKKFTLDMLASIGFTLALILSIIALLFLILVLLGYKG